MNKHWGGRFKKTLDARVVEFNSSLHFDYRLYPYDIMGSKAHATMLGQQKLITPVEAQDICHALDEIEQELNQGLHEFDVQHEDIHMFIEHLLVAKMGETGKKLHTGRSRNDQVALDLRLYTRAETQKILEKTKTLIGVLQQLSAEYANHWMPGYTHLQQAQPVSLGVYFGAYQNMFERDLSRFENMLDRMNVSPLGAGALAGSRLPLNRNSVADALSFDGVIENTLDAVSDRDYLIEFCSAASVMMMHLSRLAEDLILWASQEFHFITLDDAFSTGSSLMPNKKNPDVLELIRGKSGRVYGHLMALLTVMKGLPMAYNKDMQEDKEALFDTVDTLNQCLTVIAPFLQSVQWNTDHMQKQSQGGFLNATYVLESLVLKGMPFRDAHHQVGQWVMTAMERGVTLQDVIEEK